MLHVVCINAENYQGRGVEYVNCLYDGVRRNLPEGFAGDFTVFTDSETEEYATGILERPLPEPSLKGWWHKLSLFKPGLLPDGDRILYLDLSVCITGPLDDIAAYEGNFAILRDFYRPRGLQSSVMAWKAGSHTDIWQRYELLNYPQDDPDGDQAWIEKCVSKPDLWQSLFPGQFISYKANDCRFSIPKGARIVCFHGHPKCHEVQTAWVPKVWKVGGGTSLEMIVEANVALETIAKNIHHALRLKNAKWLNMRKPSEGEVLVCAGGPSLSDDLDSIRARAAAGAEVWTVNGSLAFLDKCDIKSQAHVMLDARPENLQFVPPLDHPCERFYSSHCDPTVLYAAGQNLTIYHPYFEGVEEITGQGVKGAFVGGGTTAGLKAVAIAYARGCRKIHLYGFDSSYRDSENHAYPQPMNDKELMADVELEDGQKFKCARWMVTQAEDFCTLAEELTAQGVELYIHGTGLLPAMAARAKTSEYAVEGRTNAILKRLEGKPDPVVGEIGVFTGQLSKRLLARRQDLKLIMVDSWGANQAMPFRATEDYHAVMSQEEQDECFETAKAMTSFAHDRTHIIRKLSMEAAADICDHSLDLVFIDADHSYEGCKSDIHTYWDKVKPGGIVGGDDYANDTYKFGPMVKRAVDEFVAAKGLELELDQSYTWWVQKPGAMPS